jgi:hypothetical protein
MSVASHVHAVQYRFTNIADTTTAVLDGLVIEFFTPVTSAGHVAFRSLYMNSEGEAKHGIFMGNGGPLATIVKTGDLAPSGVFGFQFSDPVISGSNVSFQATYTGGGGVFMASGGALTTIAKPGDPVPPETVNAVFGRPSISNETVAFHARLGAGYESTKQGILISSGGQLVARLTTDDPAPSGTSNFLGFGDPAISDSVVAFGAGYRDGGVTRSGIFTEDGDELTTIVRTGDTAPLGSFDRLGNPTLSDGTAAFAAIFGSFSMSGIFIGDGGPLTTIVKSGDAAPSGTFLQFGYPSIVGGEVAFLATFDGKSGIFTGSGGPLSKVILSGDSLFGSTVGWLDFGRFGFDSDGSGRLAFAYGLADGRLGVALATVVPEPSTLTLIGASLAALGIKPRVCRKTGTKEEK